MTGILIYALVGFIVVAACALYTVKRARQAKARNAKNLCSHWNRVIAVGTPVAYMPKPTVADATLFATCAKAVVIAGEAMVELTKIGIVRVVDCDPVHALKLQRK